MKRKYYLIDTENVGDRWIDLIGSLKEEEILVVFYTKNHSKLLEEKYLKQRYNKQIRWVECLVGTNALDHQLMGVLSYLIATHGEASYVIFSNDTDYQNGIDFWQQRNVDLSLIHFPDGRKKEESREAGTTAVNSTAVANTGANVAVANGATAGLHAAAVSGVTAGSHVAASNGAAAGLHATAVNGASAGSHTAASNGVAVSHAVSGTAAASHAGSACHGAVGAVLSSHASASQTGAMSIPDVGLLTETEKVMEIAKTVPTSQMSGWYAILVSFLGQETGRKYYLQIRGDEERKARLSKYLLPDPAARNLYLIKLLYQQSHLDVNRAEESYRIVKAHNRKNKKAIKADFEKHFGKKTGEGARYFRTIKPVIDILKGK